MKIIILLLLISFLFSCEEKKIEFVLSESYGNLILLKNPSKNDSLIKNSIKNLLLKNHKKYDKDITYFSFYKYTNKTEYFLKNREDVSGGLSNNELNDYPKDEIAAFIISKCKNDSTKLVGKLYFYGLKGSDDGQKEIDTLIYKCN